MRVSVNVVNSFTAEGKGGNPAGVVLDSAQLSDEQMQFIAKEMGFSETAFVSKDSSSEYEVRFFTPNTEVDLCGHATIATWSQLFINGLQAGSYSQNTKAGKLSIKIEADGTVFMEQPKAKFYEVVPRGEVAKALGIAEEDLSPNLEPQIVSTGFKGILVPLRTKPVLTGIKPDPSKLSQIKHEAGGGFHVFVLLDGQESIATARNFAPELGILEESATGTANGALLCYLKNQQIIDGQKVYRIEQGENLGLRSYIYGKFIDDIVWIGGMANIIKEEIVEL